MEGEKILEQYRGSVAIRGLLLTNQHPIPKVYKSLRKPEEYRASKLAKENKTHFEDIFSHSLSETAVLSPPVSHSALPSRSFQLQTAPYIHKMTKYQWKLSRQSEKRILPFSGYSSLGGPSLLGAEQMRSIQSLCDFRNKSSLPMRISENQIDFQQEKEFKKAKAAKRKTIMQVPIEEEEIDEIEEWD